MGKAVPFVLLLAAAACGSNDNQIFGGIPPTTITPLIAFDNVASVISGKLTLRDADGNSTGSSAEVVIIADRPALCDKLKQAPDYFRNPPEAYRALILFVPATDRVGVFFLDRPDSAGTGSEIIGSDPTKTQASIDRTGKPVAPFKAADLGYISLGSDWSDSPGAQFTGTFDLIYADPPELPATAGYRFTGKFKATVCPTLEGTLLP